MLLELAIRLLLATLLAFFILAGIALLGALGLLEAVFIVVGCALTLAIGLIVLLHFWNRAVFWG